MLEVNVLLKEAGLYRPHDPAAAAIMVVPLFETIGDLESVARPSCAPGWRCPRCDRPQIGVAIRKSWSAIRIRTRTAAT